ncbi:hypothetical protein MHBO_003734 [Bonamia ostreae]|uniref:Uncharacterized protein n=1 Tax=Bonamia ostreae TaxID=126728 RepID=A0ABV2ARC2_9EUKA
MSHLSVRKIPGVGKVTERILKEIGIEKCKDILKNVDLLFKYFKEKTVIFLVNSALGIGSIEKSKNDQRKSISTERVFRPLNNRFELEQKLTEICSVLANVKISIFLRKFCFFNDFRTILIKRDLKIQK